MEMRKQAIQLISGLAVAILMIALPTISQASTVSSVVVDLGGGNTYCSTNLVCAHQIWNLGAGGVDLSTGALVLTQTNGFNFDTSDLLLSSQATITINGSVVFTDDGRILTQPHGVDPLNTSHNEAIDWTNPSTAISGGFHLWVGYADNAHTNTCADADLNCLPENPWQGTTPNFIGSAATSTSGCLRPGITSCFDAGAIRIENAAVPEPSPLILIGMGLLGVAFVTRKRGKALLSKL
jgi:hypothetical protein